MSNESVEYRKKGLTESGKRGKQSFVNLTFH